MHQPGDHIDIWVVEKQLGSGGMGSVYRCHNRAAPRILAAIKVLESSLRRNSEAEARFVREAEILHGLDHPHIVKVRNVRTDCDPPYLEMEFVEGQSLEDWLVEGPIDYGLAVRLMLQLADAIRYLHGQEIRHRDIKPANLLVQAGHAIKLVDFGLAVETDRTRITHHGMAFGTVSYAPPEWIHPESLDPAKWDHYALGVVFFEMLTGRLAFPASGQGSARQQAMQVIVGKQGHRPLDPGTAFPEPVRSLIGALTEADPARRLSDLDEVVQRIGAIVAKAPEPGDSPIVDPASIPEPPEHTVPSGDSGQTWRSADPATVRRLRTRGLWVAGLGAVAGLGLLALGMGVAWWIVAAIGEKVRDVEVAVERDVHVVLDGRLPRGGGDGVQHFDRIPVGQAVELLWARGEQCRADACPGEKCPAWCGAGVQEVVVPEGEGRFRLTPELPEPPVHDLTVVLPAYDALARLEASLDGITGDRRGGEIRFAGVTPGPHTLLVRGGKCAPDAPACWPDGQCGDRCVVYRAERVVAWSGDDERVELGLPVPERRRAKLFPREPEPAPRPRVVANTPNGLATTAAFSAWLTEHPEWQVDGSKGSAQATLYPLYLSGWAGASPPPGHDPRGPVTGVSHPAATAYCANRGGLPEAGAPPTTWDEGRNGVAFEWRDRGFNPVIRGSTGEVVDWDGGTPTMMAITGVRCAR